MNEKTSQFSGRHKGQGTWVKDLSTRVGRQIYERFMVLNRPELRQARNQDWFLSVELGDKTGTIQLRIWKIPELEKDRVCSWFVEEGVYAIGARVDEYKDQTQLSMTWDQRKPLPWKCEFSGDPETTDYFLDDFVQLHEDWQAFPAERMVKYVEAVIDSMSPPGYRALLKSFWDDPEWQGRFVRWPAGKFHHHAFLGGLLQHVYEMLMFVDNFGVVAGYPELNVDLLRTGTILHDIGKLSEYLVGAQIRYNEEAFKLGHMVIAVREIDRRVREQAVLISEGELEALYHLILSHHGEMEAGHGSVISPATYEARVLARLDHFSAELNKGQLEAKRRQS